MSTKSEDDRNALIGTFVRILRRKLLEGLYGVYPCYTATKVINAYILQGCILDHNSEDHRIKMRAYQASRCMEGDMS